MRDSRSVKQILVRTAVILLPFASFALFALIKDPAIRLSCRLAPVCPFYRLTGLYCPACGNTRSVNALTHFDVVTSLRYNATPVVLLILLALLYVELLFSVFGGRRVRIISDKRRFLFALLIVMLVYSFVRNFLPFQIIE